MNSAAADLIQKGAASICVAAVLWALGLPFVAGIALCAMAPLPLPQLRDKDEPEPGPGRMLAVVGNIGSGKSRALQSVPSGWTAVPEPIREWAPLLSAEPTVNSVTQLQLAALAHYFRLAARPDELLVVERDILSTAVFSGKMPHVIATLLAVVGLRATRLPDAVLYVDTSVAQCLENVSGRGQPGDDRVSHEMVHQLHDGHGALLDAYRAAGVAVVLRSAHTSDAEALAAAATAATAGPRAQWTSEEHVLIAAGIGLAGEASP